jgi:DNA polymerase-3 subunit gamma/tau
MKEQKKTEWITSNNDFTRLYRPKTLADIVGQSILKHIVRGWMRQKKVPGAVLIHGQFGSGKTTTARIIATTLNCSNVLPNGDPCGECSSCKTMYSDTVVHNDYLEINAANNTGVDHMRLLQERASYQPRYNRLVIVIDEVHGLSKQAMDLILKNLEEPRAYVTYILCTTEPHKLSETLRSRCTELRVTEITVKDNVELLRRVCKDEKLKLSDDILEMICAKSDNIPRKCLVNLQSVASMLASGDVKEKDIVLDKLEAKLSQIIGVPNYVSIQNYLSAIYSGKLVAALSSLNGITSKPLFLKGCLDTHGNVITALASKTPEKLIGEKWVLGYTKKMIAESSLQKTSESMKTLSSLMFDLVDAYTKMSLYQLGDSTALLVGIAGKWCGRFKETGNG